MQSSITVLSTTGFGSVSIEIELGNSKWWRNNTYVIAMKLNNYIGCNIA